MKDGYGYRSEQRLRKENQDTFGVFELSLGTLVVVCDGMGGHVGGAQASALAVRTLHDVLSTVDESEAKDPRAALKRAVETANRVIYETARKNYRLTGMGTTIVVALITGSTAHIVHVGDSRAFLLRGGEVRQITRDHTMVNLFVDAELLAPEDAATHPEAHVLSRSLGVERHVDVEQQPPLQLQSNDRLVLTSDGVHGVVGSAALAQLDWSNPQRATDAVIAAVENANGDDNATLVVFAREFVGTSSPPTGAPDAAAMQDVAEQHDRPVGSPMRPEDGPDDDVAPIEDLDNLAANFAPRIGPHALTQEGARKAQERSNFRAFVAMGALTVVGTVLGALVFRDRPVKGEGDHAAMAGMDMSGHGNMAGMPMGEHTAPVVVPLNQQPAPTTAPAVETTATAVAGSVDPSAPSPAAVAPVPVLNPLVPPTLPPTPPQATPPQATPPQATPPQATPPQATPPQATPPQAASTAPGLASAPALPAPPGVTTTQLPAIPGQVQPIVVVVEGTDWADTLWTGDGTTLVVDAEAFRAAGGERDASVLAWGSSLASATGDGSWAPPPRCIDCTRSLSRPSSLAYLRPEGGESLAGTFFKPAVPAAPVRTPVAPQRYSENAPRGPAQATAIRQARSKECREAMQTVDSAMERSVDHAVLYRTAWICFNENDQLTLSQANATTFREFQALEPHFRGTAVKAGTPVMASADGSVAPGFTWTWGQPAQGGIEYRLERFLADRELRGFQDVMFDMVGEPTVADQLGVDLLLEATAAAAASRSDANEPALIDMWARRVYYDTAAMNGALGSLIREYRPELAEVIDNLLFEATGGDAGAQALADGLPNTYIPEQVALAQAKALGITVRAPEPKMLASAEPVTTAPHIVRHTSPPPPRRPATPPTPPPPPPSAALPASRPSGEPLTIKVYKARK